MGFGTSKRAQVVLAAAVAAGASFAGAARAADIYWDINGTTAGATNDGGGVASGTWNGTNTNWTTDATGASATQAFVTGDNVSFSAGTNATGASAISVSGTQTVGNFTVEEGTVVISGSAVANGSNTAFV